MKNSFEVLEIEKVLELFRKYAKTSKCYNKISSLRGKSDKKSILSDYQKLKEMYLVYENYNEPPIYSKLDLEEEVLKLKKGAIMEPLKLNLLKDEIYSSIELNKFATKIKLDNVKEINALFSKIKPSFDLYNKIAKSIGNDGNVLDGASIELSRIRKEIQNVDKKIHSVLNGIFNSNRDKINGDNYVIRNGHYALPISSSLKNSVSGIIHDISDSGATTFIEPYEIAELENQKNILSLKERDEISKILDSFRSDILFNSYQLIANNNVISELDFLMCKVKFMKEYKATIPEINSVTSFKFNKAKHPLLDKDTCVANDFLLGNDKTLMLISGPNAGGKTVALKTIATLAYMVKLALPITAEEGSSSYIFNNIYVDIGDNQSLENNLSTFSSQISNISSILKNVTNKDLVIFDEICNGTDPKEGEALAISITKYLLEVKSLSIISSHYTLLKKFGLENPSILNASFIFDERKIRPTFRILLGVSGKSFGFLIANKFGIDEKIVEEAKTIYEKNYLSEEDRRIEVIEDKERELSFKEERLKTFEKRLSQEQSKIDQEKNKIKIRTEKLNQNKSEEFDKYLDTKYQEINDVYKEFLKEKNAKKALEKLASINIDETDITPINPGDYVEIRGLETKGVVTLIKGNKLTLNTEDGFSINTSLDQVKKIPSPKKEIKSNINLDKEVLSSPSVSYSLNLIGYRGYEGVEAMETYISQAIRDGKKSVRVIHGYGSGRLRMALWDALKKNKYVASFELGNDTNGGSGSTIIKLK